MREAAWWGGVAGWHGGPIPAGVMQTRDPGTPGPRDPSVLAGCQAVGLSVTGVWLVGK